MSWFIHGFVHNLTSPSAGEKNSINVKKEILDRVMSINHRACNDIETEIDDFIRGWKELCREEKPLVYYTYGHLDKYNRLLNYYHEYCNGREKPTLNSMREVEKAATIYYYNEEEG